MKKTTAVLAMTLGLAIAGAAYAQQKTMSIGTGGTGGVYYPLGGGMANILSKYVPGLQATIRPGRDWPGVLANNAVRATSSVVRGKATAEGAEG